MLLLMGVGGVTLLLLPLHLIPLADRRTDETALQAISATPSAQPSPTTSPPLSPSPSPAVLPQVTPRQLTTPTPSATPLQQAETELSKIGDACARPYSSTSPWNTRLGSNVAVHPKSTQLLTSLSGAFGADVNQYTYPVYVAQPGNSLKTMRVNKTYSDVIAGSTLQRTSQGVTIQLPLPDGAEPAAGDDAQFILINPQTGDEWGFYEVSRSGDGWQATNGYHYNMKWSGVPPSGFGSRGAGVPYLAGLIRKCEIERGVIDHAIAFAHNYPCSKEACERQGFPYFVYPATKSDGYGTHEYAFPEGTRLQLNPNATAEQITSWCTGDSRVNERSCRIVVKALQEYGMITIDQSGHPKIYAEGAATAQWGNLWHANMPRKIPYSEFRVIAF